MRIQQQQEEKGKGRKKKKGGGRRSIESQSGAEESPAKSLSLLGSGLPKKTSRGMKPKKNTHWCVLCAAQWRCSIYNDEYV
jgi:hypothetical protein